MSLKFCAVPMVRFDILYKDVEVQRQNSDHVMISKVIQDLNLETYKGGMSGNGRCILYLHPNQVEIFKQALKDVGLEEVSETEFHGDHY